MPSDAACIEAAEYLAGARQSQPVTSSLRSARRLGLTDESDIVLRCRGIREGSE